MSSRLHIQATLPNGREVSGFGNFIIVGAASCQPDDDYLFELEYQDTGDPVTPEDLNTEVTAADGREMYLHEYVCEYGSIE